MPYMVRIGTGSVIAMILFIPLLILMTIFIPILMLIVLLMAAAAVLASGVISGAKRLGRGKERDRKQKEVIDVEYRIK